MIYLLNTKGKLNDPATRSESHIQSKYNSAQSHSYSSNLYWDNKSLHNIDSLALHHTPSVPLETRNPCHWHPAWKFVDARKYLHSHSFPVLFPFCSVKGKRVEHCHSWKAA